MHAPVSRSLVSLYPGHMWHSKPIRGEQLVHWKDDVYSEPLF